MYINFWYPIGRSTDLTADKPLKAQVLGLPFVAFRDQQGQAHVLSDTCVHRGGSLGKGTVRDGCVVCPYHGWRYSGDGSCVLVPSLGKGKPPARAKVDSYPVDERYGIVFAFLGDLPEEERPPVYQIEEFGQQGWRDSEIVILDVPFYYERSIENGLDPAHNEFVHPMQGSPAMEPDFFAKGVKVEDIPWGSRFLVNYNEQTVKPTTSGMQELRSNQSELCAGSGHQGPNALVTWINFSRTNALHQYFFEAPVDENNTRIFFINMRNCMLEPEKDESVRKINLNIAHEDIAILQELNPVRTPESNIKEVLLPADQPAVRFRQYLREWEGRGWRIDRKTLRETKGDIAYAIPCPARRTSGNWVLDPVPLMPARQQESARRPAASNVN